MPAETEVETRFAALAAAFPLGPIRDEASYNSAIVVLDQLFGLGNQHPDEQRYFRLLARRARNFERTWQQV